MKVELDLVKDEVSLELAKLKRHIPFITAATLTKTAKQASIVLNKSTAKYIDRPKPITSKGFTIKPAKKKEQLPKAIVLMKKKIQYYFTPQIIGGSKRQTKIERVIVGIAKKKGYYLSGKYLVPVNSAPKDKYGNLRRSILKKMAKSSNWSYKKGKKEYFFVRNNVIYRAVARKSGSYKITPLAVAHQSVTYKARFPMGTIAGKITKKKLPKFYRQMVDQVKQEIRSKSK